MLRKISSVLIRVNDVAEAIDFYSDVFGLKPIWEDQQSQQAGLLFPESDAEIILHSDPTISGQAIVQYLVDDVMAAVELYVTQGCTVLTEPFATRTGRGAIIQDPFGTRLYLIDMSKARREAETL